MRATLFVLAAGLLLGSPLHADANAEGEALVKKSGCLACHQATRKVVGPAYVDVAKKYKGQAGAVAKLTQKVKKGGSGVWGQIPMTPHPQIAEADIEKMVKWILAGAGGSAPAAAPKAAEPKAEVKAEVKEAAPAAEEHADNKPKRKKKKAHAAAAHGGHGHKEALAWATDEQVRDLMTKQDCFGCHSGINSVDEATNKPWPSFKQIEARAKNSDVAGLVKKVQSNSGANRYGSIPHPVYPQLPAEAVEASVRYILAGKASAAPVAANAADMDGQTWMKTRSDCFSCHQVAAKVVGPSYRDVAKKYAEKDVATLVKKVKAGGSGNWGNVPMTAHPNASDEMLEKAVRWILTQK